MENSFISIKTILDRVLKHPLLSDLRMEDMVDYVVDFTRIVGSPALFEDRIEVIPIQNYRGLIPCECVDITQVKYGNTCIREATDTFHTSIVDRPVNINTDINEYEEVLDENNNIVAYKKLMTDVEYVSADAANRYVTERTDFSFKTQGNYIYTSFPSGQIQVAFKAIATDADGYPMVIDNANFNRAIEAYIRVQRFSILFDLGQVHGNVLSNAQTQYAWAVGSLETDLQKMNLSKAESFYNSFSTLLARTNEFTKGFKNTGVKEILKRH